MSASVSSIFKLKLKTANCKNFILYGFLYVNTEYTFISFNSVYSACLVCYYVLNTHKLQCPTIYTYVCIRLLSVTSLTKSHKGSKRVRDYNSM
jgi:hypothetical protein